MNMELGATSIDLPRCAGAILELAGYSIDTPPVTFPLTPWANESGAANVSSGTSRAISGETSGGLGGGNGLVLGGGGSDAPLRGGGGNNRVYRVEAADRSFVLKQYFQHPDDPRDRMGAEFSFIRLAWNRGLRCVPMPVGRLFQMNLALYGFVPGRRLVPSEIKPAHVQQAVDFVRKLNAPADRHDAQDRGGDIPLASDSCFSLQEHLDHVTRRVDRLAAMPMVSAEHEQAVAWVRSELKPRVDESVQAFLDIAKPQGWDIQRKLEAQERRLSPSDFGFHNALWEESGKLTFIDFEYAGWDDPRKIVADFFTQVAVPVPPEHWPMMAESLLDPVGRQQAQALLPLYRWKWVCLVLNAFLPVDHARRRFAKGDQAAHESLAHQLSLAQRLSRQALERSSSHPIPSGANA